MLHEVLMAWQMMRRDWRAGELRLLLLALVVAVAAVTSVSFLADRLRAALERDAAQLLGADLVLRSDRPIPAEWLQRAQALGLETVISAQFPSMAVARGAGSGSSAGNSANAELRTELVAVRSVEDGYPLRGTVRIAPQPDAPDVPAEGIPQPGHAWVDAQLLHVLQLEPGDELSLGQSRFTIESVIVIEPDRGTNFVNVAPRVMIRHDELEATGLVTVGSRLRYRLMVAGEPAARAQFESWVSPQLTLGQDLETVETGRPEMQQTIDRAQQFLSLVALLAALVAAVAVALAARRFTLRHLDSVAIMRCVGAPASQVSRLFALEFLFIATLGAVFGSLLGWVGQAALLAALGNLITTTLPPPSIWPALQGAAAGVWLLLGFALPPLAQLRHVPPIRVLRRDAGMTQARTAFGYLIGAVGFAGILVWFAQDLRLGLTVAGGFLAGFLVFAVVAFAGVRLLEPVRQWQQGSVALRFALAGVVRRKGATVAQVCALSVGLMALLLLALTRNDLIEGWQNAAPADAPNRFLINIQPDQRDAIAERLQQTGLEQAELYPMIRGRLVEVNGNAVDLANFEGNDRAQRLLDREFNLSYMDTLPGHNRVVQGRWLDPNAMEVSMESGIMETLGLAMNDQLVFDIAGERVQVQVTGVRDLDWDSMKVNFFAILSPAALQDMPQSFITSFHLPAGQESLGRELVRDFPNLTVFDLGAVLRQVQDVLSQVIAAVQFLFLFTLAAGCLVLYAALAATRDERVREAGLLRAIGASRQQLSRAQHLELVVIGAFAGLMASLGALLIADLLARLIFNFSLDPNPWIPVLGIAAGVLCAWVGGWMGLRDVVRQTPMQTLREAGAA